MTSLSTVWPLFDLTLATPRLELRPIRDQDIPAAVVLYAFDWLGAEVAESEATAWNEASLGVSRALCYELNGTSRKAWGGSVVETLQHVRATPETFRKPDWPLHVQRHDAAASFLKPA